MVNAYSFSTEQYNTCIKNLHNERNWRDVYTGLPRVSSDEKMKCLLFCSHERQNELVEMMNSKLDTIISNEKITHSKLDKILKEFNYII